MGWTILATGVRLGHDEIDIVAVDPGEGGGRHPRLVFVEVRSHTTNRFGTPEESVDRRKLRALYRAAIALARGGELRDGRLLPRLSWRIDLIAVDARPALAPGVGGPVVRHIRGLSLE